MISWALARSISSRTMASIFLILLHPNGKKLYKPFAVLRIKPARSINCWLTTSASDGTSRNVGAYNLVANIKTPHLSFLNIDQFL